MVLKVSCIQQSRIAVMHNTKKLSVLGNGSGAVIQLNMTVPGARMFLVVQVFASFLRKNTPAARTLNKTKAQQVWLI